MSVKNWIDTVMHWIMIMITYCSGYFPYMEIGVLDSATNNLGLTRRHQGRDIGPVLTLTFLYLYIELLIQVFGQWLSDNSGPSSLVSRLCLPAGDLSFPM